MAENLTSFRMFTASCTGNAKNSYYRSAINITGAEDLAAACRKDHVCAAFADCHRSNDNYIRGYALAADCDNDFTEDPAAWITPSTVAAQLPGVAFYAVKSRNCDKVKHPGESGEKSARPRYHYYFPLRVPVEGYENARKLTDMFLNMFPMFDDEGTKPAQFFYGHAEPVAAYYPGEKDIQEYFRENPIEIEPEPEIEISAEECSKAVYSDDFAALNVHDMLSIISANCDYGTWYKIGMSIKAAGLPFEIWDDWSKTVPELYPGIEKMRRKWISFKGGRITFGTLVYMAQENGWQSDPDKLTGKYKASHEAAEQKKKERIAKHREDIITALAEIGRSDIEYSATLNVDRNVWDGSIIRIYDSETGEIINPANPAASAPAAKEKKPLVTGGYEDVETKPTDFLFFPWFPRGKLVSVQGDSGSSKSTFFYAVGANVTTGRDLLGTPCEDPGNVMFITIEDDPGDIKTAFLDAGGDLSRLKRIIDREQIAKLNLSPEGAQMLDKIIKAEKLKLLVLDPIQQFLTGDMNKANDTRPQLARLMNIAAENNICIGFIEHMGKDTTKAALHRAVGSVDIGASTRSMIQVVTDPEDDFYKIAFTVKNNTADFHDTQRAIRYQVKDHPGSFDPVTKKRARFHGHAEFIELLPEYNERLYKKALRKADEAEEAEEILQYSYDDDPLVITVRELISYNPQGLFIGSDDLIQRITQCAGHCPYELTRSKMNGLNNRISKLRTLMIDSDGIQADIPDNAQYAKAYHWRGMLYDPQRSNKIRGVYLTPVKSGTNGTQQTKI